MSIYSNDPDDNPVTVPLSGNGTALLQADLAIIKSDSPDPVYIGENITYILNVTNNGPDDATNVIVTDTLPANTTFVSANSTDASHAGGTVTWNVGDLAYNATANLTIIATSPLTSGNITNEASVDGNEPDNNANNDSISIDTYVSSVKTDLSITKTGSPDPVYIGDNLTYTLTVSNNGTENATGVYVLDIIALTGATYISSNTSAGTANHSGGIVTWNIGDLAVGENVTMDIYVTAPSMLFVPFMPVANIAMVMSTEVVDSDYSNNIAITTTTVSQYKADLGITKTASPDPVFHGENLTYTLSVTNHGPDTSTNVTVTDILLSGATFVSANSSSASYAGGLVTWNVGDLTADTTANLTIVVTTPLIQSIPLPFTFAIPMVNVAFVTSSEVADTNQNNNATLVTTFVSPYETDLAITKTDSPDPVYINDNLTYTINVTNYGPDNAGDIIVTDILPAGVTFVSANSTSAYNSSGIVTWNISDLPVNTTASLSILVTAPASPGNITNSTFVFSNQVPDNNVLNNNVSIDTTVSTPDQADLEIIKSDSQDPVAVGDNLTYTLIVTNHGPDNATSVNVTDTLPADIEFVSANASPGTTASNSSSIVSWNIGSLASGDDATLDILVTIGVSASDNLTNTAVVGASEGDPVQANNTATINTTILIEELATIYGTVFKDLDGNGVQTGNETGISGVTITLDGTVNTTTDTTGLYLFMVSNTGVHTVNETDPSGYFSTTPNLRHRNVDALGKSYEVNFGDAPESSGFASIYGTIFEDLDGNGVQTGNETGISGVLVSLDGTTNTTTTDLYGYYIFSTTIIGVHTVNETDPSGYFSITPNNVNVNVDALGNSYVVNFGDVLPDADLMILKSDSPDPVTAGTNITYTLIVSNNGTTFATGVNVTDTLPPGVTYVSSNTSAGSSSNNSGTVTWNIGYLNYGDSENMTILVTAPSTEGNITNTANVTSAFTDPVPTNNTASENTTVEVIPPGPEADLSITKTDSHDPVAVGDNLTYTLIVTNNGPDNATSVNVTDTLPAGLIHLSSNTSAGTALYASGNVTWNIGDLASGDNATLEIICGVTLLACGPLKNTAVVDGNETDPNPENNIAIEYTDSPCTDLVITKVDNRDPVNFSDNFTWTVTVTNNGTHDAGNVTVIDFYLANTTIIHSINPSKGTVNQTAPEWMAGLPGLPGLPIPTPQETQFYWYIGDLASGDNATLDITASVNFTLPFSYPILSIFLQYSSISLEDAFPDIPLINEAMVISSIAEPDFDNNSTYETTTIEFTLPEADLEITKSDVPDPVSLGDDITYTVEITNQGPDDAPGVFVVDGVLDSALILQDYDESTGNVSKGLPQWVVDLYSAAGFSMSGVNITMPFPTGLSFLNWDIGTLPSGTSANLTLVTTANASMSMLGFPAGSDYVVNSAAGVGEVVDIDILTDNFVEEQTDIISADLEIFKTDVPDTVVFSDNFSYILTVTNNGPTDAISINVTDTLPSGVTYLSSNTSTGTASNTSGIVTWNIDYLAKDDSANLTILVTAPPENGGYITNTAIVTSMYADPDPGNNTVSENTTLAWPWESDLVITKTDSPDPVATGDNFTYTLTVTNKGPADAEYINVQDTLSTSVTYQSANASTGDIYVQTGPPDIIYWSIDYLSKGDSANLTILVTAPSTPGVITNTASANGEYPEIDPSDNTVSENTTVAWPWDFDLEIFKTDNPDPVATGDNFTYTLTVTNHGPADAYYIEVRDDLPAGTTYQSDNASTGYTINSSGTVWWYIDYLGKGDSANLTILVTAPPTAGTITNTATVSEIGESPEPGPSNNPAPGNTEGEINYGNNTVSENTTIVTKYADLEIIKSPSFSLVNTGDNFTYTLTVTNQGPHDATGVSVSDVLPTGVTPPSFTQSTGSVNQSSGNVTWDIGNLAAGASATLSINVTAPSSPALLTNGAGVAGNELDTAPFSNISLAFTLVWPLVPDIDVSPTSVNFGSVEVGSSGTSTVTVNNTGLPTLSIGNITIDNNQFAISGGNISGQALAPGGSADITLTFTPSSSGAKSAILSIPSNDPDENPFIVFLSGTGTAPPGPTPGPFEIEPEEQAQYFTVDFLGKITREVIDDNGRPLKNIEAPSPDGVHLLEIEQGTRASDTENNTVTILEIRKASAPRLPANTVLVGSAYEFKPSGTTFDKMMRLTLGYDVSALPDDVESIGTAYYDEGWKYLETESRVVAELGKLTARLNHFTVFAILAKVPAPPEIIPEPTEEPETVLKPASFKLTNLVIEPSISRTFEKVTYIVVTGEEVTIRVDVTNEGEQQGTYAANLMINGKVRETKNVTLEPEQTKTVSFTVTAEEPGDYTVQIGDLAGNFTSESWVNWWLWVGSVGGFILLGLAIFYGVKKLRAGG